MTNKIPVGGTIARAYGFAFGNIVSNLGAIWIPVAILYGLLFLFYKPYTAAMVTMISRDPQALLRMLPYILLCYALLFVLLTAQVAALTREALGLRTGSAWLQFPFGAPMWRLLLGYLALIVVTIVLYIACFLAGLLGGLLGGLLASLVPGAAGKIVIALITAVIIIAVFCFLFLALVRLSFLLAPIAVAEGKRTLQRGWELTRGNFWRIFLIALSLVIPFLILEFAYLYIVVGPDLFPPLHASQEMLAQWQEHQKAAMLLLVERTQTYWYVFYPIGLAVSVVLYGLFAGASAFAYRALVPGDVAPAAPQV